MNILILVLSYMKPPYDSLYKAQTETWDSIEVEGVRTVYYHGGLPDNFAGCDNFPVAVNSMQLGFKITDEYYFMIGKFQKALEFMWNWEWDIIFRSNSSSYIDKRKLHEVAKNLPTEKLYAGWSLETCVSGAGIWLSRDCAKILMDEIDPNYEKEEDFAIGEILLKHGIEIIDDKSRYDVGEYVDDDIPNDRYHYRLKNADRYNDAQNFYRLHEILK